MLVPADLSASWQDVALFCAEFSIKGSIIESLWSKWDLNQVRFSRSEES